MGFKYEHVMVVSYDNGADIKDKDSLRLFFNVLRNALESMPEVEQVSLHSQNIPFSANTSVNNVDFKKTHVSGVNMYNTDYNYTKLLGIDVLEGRWFGKQDAATTYKPIVINSSLRTALFGTGQAVGQLVGTDVKMRVIGVVNSIKDKGDYSVPKSGMYFNVDTGSIQQIRKLLVKVSSNADAGFETRLYKIMSNYIKKSNIDIEKLVDKKQSMNQTMVVPMIILLIVASFLIINVALGLFGVLWYNINKRRSEIGLRRAIGASGRAVSQQIVAESMILATMSLLVGSFFAIQFPLLNVFELSSVVYLTALAASIIFIYLLVFICSVYPGRQAAKVYPAVALHED